MIINTLIIDPITPYIIGVFLFFNISDAQPKKGLPIIKPINNKLNQEASLITLLAKSLGAFLDKAKFLLFFDLRCEIN